MINPLGRADGQTLGHRDGVPLGSELGYTDDVLLGSTDRQPLGPAFGPAPPPPLTRTAAPSALPELVPFPQILSAPRCNAEPEEGVHCRARLGGVRCEVLCGSPKYGILKWVMDQVRTVLSFKTQHPISVVEGFLFKFSYALWFVVSREEAMDQSLAPPTERKSQKYYKKFWEHFYGVHFVRTPVKVPL